jgi:hypothetical protein
MPKNKPTLTGIKPLTERFEEVCADARTLFMEYNNGAMAVKNIPHRDFIVIYCDTLDAVKRDLTRLAGVPGSAVRYARAIDDIPDSMDCINRLAAFSPGNALESYLENCVLDVLTAMGQTSAAADRFILAHAERICASVQLLISYLNLLQGLNAADVLPRTAPAFFAAGAKPAVSFREKIQGERLLTGLTGRATAPDIFSNAPAFRYLDGQFVAAELNSIRPVGQFFGYNDVRRLFQQHFASFVAGESNLPLLISSLPGLGKTHFSIAYTLSHPELTLVLLEPAMLGHQFEIILRRLAMHKNRKFVLFFDDLDPEKIDWYYFRTNVGGSFSLPGNIALVLAANYDFPANITSRGRGINFPMFDEIRCQEMVMDFLVSIGMKHCRNELVSVIAADYCEEFGQKKIAELSPRTLIRYLESYKQSPVKRKQMLDFSKKEIIARPDAQIFYNFNVKILRMLYGEEALEVLRQEKIRQSL